MNTKKINTMMSLKFLYEILIKENKKNIKDIEKNIEKLAKNISLLDDNITKLEKEGRKQNT